MTTRARRFGARALPLLVLSTALATATTVLPHAAIGDPASPTPLADSPQVYAIAQDANQALRYSLATVAADPDADYPAGGLEAGLRDGIRSLPADEADRLIGAARSLVYGSDAARRAQFGRYARFSPEEYRRLGFDGAFRDVPFDQAALQEELISRADAIEAADRAAETVARRAAEDRHLDISLLPTLHSLDFRVDAVNCVDETNPEWPGDDEMLIGGVAVDNAGVTTKVDQWFVGDGFSDGVGLGYADPGAPFAGFDLTTPGPWPRGFLAVVMLAEEDGGGFADAIQAAWKQVGDKVKQAIAQAVAGVLTPYLGAAIAQALGQVVGWLVGVFVDWLLEFFEDDLFDARTAYVELPHRLEFLYNAPGDLGWTNHRLPGVTMTFTGHGGQYTVDGHWQIGS